MGVGTYPIVEDYEDTEPATLDNFVEWKYLTDCFFQLRGMAESFNVTPLHNFHNYCLDDALNDWALDEVEEMQEEAALVDGWYELAEGGRLWTPERVWFSADDGLKTTRALIKHLQQHPEAVDADEGNVGSFVFVLQELEKVLVEAQQNGKRFYLASE
ncbi:MAG TPA: hypothetical protein VM821_07835 [Abditibacteriaceae bacterium]|jgi:hypothetical protein|nr:hypothetical protein [Abditibacteriaceae bacterium]